MILPLAYTISPLAPGPLHHLLVVFLAELDFARLLQRLTSGNPNTLVPSSSCILRRLPRTGEGYGNSIFLAKAERCFLKTCVASLAWTV